MQTSNHHAAIGKLALIAMLTCVLASPSLAELKPSRSLSKPADPTYGWRWPSQP
jgi:hypothetical protein